MLRLERAKTGPRTVWLSDAAQAILDRQPRNGSAYVFPSPADPARPRNSDNMRFREFAREEASIEDVRVHDLRYTVASQAVARGVALSTVARMLGHADPRMTLRYAHVRDPEVEAAAEWIGTVIEVVMAGGELPSTDRSRGCIPVRNPRSTTDRTTRVKPKTKTFPRYCRSTGYRVRNMKRNIGCVDRRSARRHPLSAPERGRPSLARLDGYHTHLKGNVRSNLSWGSTFSSKFDVLYH